MTTMDRPTLFTDNPEPRVVKFPFRLSPEERSFLGEQARSRGTTPTRLMRLALRAYLVESAPQEQKGKRR